MTGRRRARAAVALLMMIAPAAGSAAAPAAPQGSAAADALAYALLNTTDSVGSVTAAAEAMAQRFRAAGFPPEDVFVGGASDRKKNVVVRLHGSGKHKPLLLIGHLDVVEARREDWTTDPFQLVEKDRFFYGRGTQDMKDGDAIMATTLLRMKKGGFRPSRDIILAHTASTGC